jgi:murein DD-endopeptidase MepM/ murein hydrolase activator NlpD
VPRRASIAFALLALPLLAGSAGAAERATGSATARAVALRVTVPGVGGTATTTVAAPEDAVSFGAPSAYPNGAGVSWGSSVASASASVGDSALASASAGVESLSLFGGEVSIGSIRGSVKANASPGGAGGDFSGSGVSGITVGGQTFSPGPGQQVPLGDWGYAVALAQSAAPGRSTYSASITALDIRLTADHGGLPAGTQVQVGYAEVAVEAPQAPPKPVEPPGKPKPRSAPKQAPGGEKPPEPDEVIPPLVRPVPPSVRPKLSPKGYVFPVYGPASFTNTFGAPRANVVWHHGEDIFAPLGAPILAVAKGTVFSVGWNDLGGYRLWLRDEQGNQFYYAHLSAFSPLAVNGAHVRAGDVLGFVGNSGDAQGTPYHLHFEIHPVGMLSAGYDGVVPPYEYLLRWRRLEDLRFATAEGWAPSASPSATAPKPGAILLQASDISVASGLRPGSVSRAFRAPAAAEGDGALIRGLAPLAAPAPAGRR